MRGEKGLQAALQATRVMFGNEPIDSLPASGSSASQSREGFNRLILLSVPELLAVMKDVPSVTLPRSSVVGQALTALMVAGRVTTSKGEARRLVKSGGVYVNSKRVLQEDYQITADDVLNDSLCVLRVGKKNYFLVKMLVEGRGGEARSL